MAPGRNAVIFFIATCTLNPKVYYLHIDNYSVINQSLSVELPVQGALGTSTEV